MIIGLTGLKGSGKDTVAAMLIKQHGYERRAFADPLKKSVAGLFNIPFKDVDKFKNDKCVYVILCGEYADEHDHATYDAIGSPLTFREFLQRYGTEAHRDVPEMGTDFWIDLTLPPNGYYAQDRNIVISDVRFDNEAARIFTVGGHVVEVVRPGTDTQDQHRSEAGIDPDRVDYTIFNNGTLDDLQTGVEIMLERLG